MARSSRSDRTWHSKRVLRLRLIRPDAVLRATQRYASCTLAHGQTWSTQMTQVADRHTVAVVIPCFNQARYLASAVASVRRQHHHPVECIVVDDGSTDDTAAVASELGVRVIVQPNSGVAQARNSGLD